MSTMGEKTDHTRVHVDAELAEILPRYLDNRRRDAVALEEAVAQGDFDRIRTLGHQFKGSGGAYGLDAITRMGAALESAAKARDLATIRKGTAEIREFLQCVHVVYDGS